MRPPESARAALTASAIASRVGNVAPEGPAAVEPAGYRKCRASSKPGRIPGAHAGVGHAFGKETEDVRRDDRLEEGDPNRQRSPC